MIDTVTEPSGRGGGVMMMMMMMMIAGEIGGRRSLGVHIHRRNNK